METCLVNHVNSKLLRNKRLCDLYGSLRTKAIALGAPGSYIEGKVRRERVGRT